MHTLNAAIKAAVDGDHHETNEKLDVIVEEIEAH